VTWCSLAFLIALLSSHSNRSSRIIYWYAV
jgi:hypothetical protein